MDNRDEKTFTDLFANSTTESKTTQTFGDILNSDTKEKEDTPSSVTFDSIFDKIPQEENTKELEEKFGVLEHSNKDQSQTFNSIFDDEHVNSAIEEKEHVDENIDSDKTELEFSEFNPFIETESEESSKQQPSTEETNNIFFQANDTSTNIKKIDESENSIFDANTKIEEPVKNEMDFTINPFMDDNIDTSVNEIEETETIDNPFFTETTIDSAPQTDANPFFGGSDSSNQLETESTNSIESRANNPEVLSPQQEEVKPKSTSPFFEEEKKAEENPFFQNQINLIENQIPNSPSGSIDTSQSKHYNVKIVKKKEPLIKFILGVLSYALFIWLLLIGVTLLIYVLDIKIRAAKGDYSSPTFNAYVVLTGSMLPEIKVYDVVVTKKIDAKDLKEGDVITFASADSRFLGTIITHRIIKKNPPSDTEGYTFQTKGDNNNVADSALVPANNIYGKVILNIPKLGYLQEFLASDGGWIIVILIPCLTVISYDTVKLIKGLKRKKYKNIKVQK